MPIQILIKKKLSTQIKKKKNSKYETQIFFFQIPNPFAQPFTAQSTKSACSRSSKILSYII